MRGPAWMDGGGVGGGEVSKNQSSRGGVHRLVL